MIEGPTTVCDTRKRVPGCVRSNRCQRYFCICPRAPTCFLRYYLLSRSIVCHCSLCIDLIATAEPSCSARVVEVGGDFHGNVSQLTPQPKMSSTSPLHMTPFADLHTRINTGFERFRYKRCTFTAVGVFMVWREFAWRVYLCLCPVTHHRVSHNYEPFASAEIVQSRARTAEEINTNCLKLPPNSAKGVTYTASFPLTAIVLVTRKCVYCRHKCLC